MRIYSLGTDGIRDHLIENSEYKSGIEVSKLLSQMNGFFTISGDDLLFLRKVKAGLLVKESTEKFPLTYSYRINTDTESGLRFQHAIQEWRNVEELLKKEFHLAEDDTILYVEKLRRFFVNTKHTYDQFVLANPVDVLTETRAHDFQVEMTKVLEGLKERYDTEVVPMRRVMVRHKIISLLGEFEVRDLTVPEGYEEFKTPYNREDDLGDFM